MGLVCDKGDALGAAGAVVYQFQVLDRSDALEEALDIL
jgi:hypothetical protein